MDIILQRINHYYHMNMRLLEKLRNESYANLFCSWFRSIYLAVLLIKFFVLYNCGSDIATHNNEVCEGIVCAVEYESSIDFHLIEWIINAAFIISIHTYQLQLFCSWRKLECQKIYQDSARAHKLIVFLYKTPDTSEEDIRKYQILIKMEIIRQEDFHLIDGVFDLFAE